MSETFFIFPSGVFSFNPPITSGAHESHYQDYPGFELVGPVLEVVTFSVLPIVT